MLKLLKFLRYRVALKACQWAYIKTLSYSIRKNGHWFTEAAWKACYRISQPWGEPNWKPGAK